jgi:hypothetical protein
MSFTWVRLQSEVARWVEKNFPTSPPRHQALGLIEELGELAHARLKSEQGIRGSVEQHTADAQDAVADSVIFFMHACSNLGWGSQEILRTTTPDEFQKTFSVPPGRSAVVHALKGLANFVEQIDLAENARTAIEKDAHLELAKNASLIYLSGLAAYCTQMGWSLQRILDEVWPTVRARDWTKNVLDGGAVAVTTNPEDPTMVDVAVLAP